MSNIQVTHGTSLNDARSESVVLINPKNPQQVVGASRKCKDIAAYDFTVAIPRRWRLRTGAAFRTRRSRGTTAETSSWWAPP